VASIHHHSPFTCLSYFNSKHQQLHQHFSDQLDPNHSGNRKHHAFEESSTFLITLSGIKHSVANKDSIHVTEPTGVTLQNAFSDQDAFTVLYAISISVHIPIANDVAITLRHSTPTPSITYRDTVVSFAISVPVQISIAQERGNARSGTRDSRVFGHVS
jgi:hypothetical protein